MATITDLARMSLDVYDASKSASGQWRRRMPFGNRDSGFFASLYQLGPEFTLAFRGTDDVLRDGMADLQLALGRYPTQFTEAAAAIRQARQLIPTNQSTRLYVTGHSLGGGLASLVGFRTGLPAVTFNAPGMARAEANRIIGNAAGLDGALREIARNIVAAQLDDSKKAQNITNIRARHDLVSIGTGATLGEDITISNFCPAPESQGSSIPIVNGVVRAASALGEGSAYVLCQHSMDQMYLAVRSDPRFQRTLTV